MSPDAIFRVESADEAGAILTSKMGEDDVVLVKASRALGLERIVECIK